MVATTTPRGWFEPAGEVPRAVALPAQSGPPPVSGGLQLDPEPVVLDAARLRAADVDALLAEALTARPNEVVLDLTGPDGGDVPRHRVRRAVRALDAWPHPPVLVAVDPPHGLPLKTPDPTLGIDLVAGVSLASAVVTARRWVDAASLTMTPPVVSRALALGHVVAFLERVGSPVAVEDAVECTDALLRWAVRGDAVRVDVRLAADDDRLGIALSWRPSRPTAGSSAAGGPAAAGDDRAPAGSFAVPLLGTLMAHGAHTLGEDRLGWLALRRPAAVAVPDAG